MRSKTDSGMITYRDRFDIDYGICIIEQTVFENEDFRYEFRPAYKVIDILPKEFDGIPGLDLELRKETYVRENILPVFIADRVPPKNRENIHEELAEVGLQYYDALEWLLRTDRRYFGDSLRVVPVYPIGGCYEVDSNATTIASMCSDILNAMGKGKDIILDGKQLGLQECRAVADFARILLDNELKSKKLNPVGRRPKDVDPFELEQICKDISKGRMTLEEGLETLGISRATFYRRMKEFGLRI